MSRPLRTLCPLVVVGCALAALAWVLLGGERPLPFPERPLALQDDPAQAGSSDVRMLRVEERVPREGPQRAVRAANPGVHLQAGRRKVQRLVAQHRARAAAHRAETRRKAKARHEAAAKRHPDATSGRAGSR
jgi:hypothetical protein